MKLSIWGFWVQLYENLSAFSETHMMCGFCVEPLYDKSEHSLCIDLAVARPSDRGRSQSRIMRL